MADLVTNVTYSQNGKLYAGMKKEDIRAHIDSQEFKTDKKREKAFNKEIKIFDYADGLVDGVKDGVISEEEILAYDKKEKTKKIWKTVGLVAAGVAVTIGGIMLAKKFGAFSKIKKLINNRDMVDANSKELFSFAEKHTLKAPGGVMSEDGLILTHVTDYLPREGYIDTARSAVGASRDSVHFAVNHGVTSHALGNWDSKKYAILSPMKSTLGVEGNEFVGGVAADFYSRGRVKLPKDAVIVRYNEAIPAGKYRISDASKIKEMCDLKGIRLIETSEKNMKTTVDNIIPRLGYDLKDTSDAWYWGKQSSKSRFREFKRFSKFLEAHGLKPVFHTYTPNAKMEMLIESIMARSSLGLGWAYDKNGQVIINAKDETLKLIDYIKKYAEETKYPLNFDISKLKQIISEAATPQAALDEIGKTMHITASMTDPSKMELLRGAGVLEQEATLQGIKVMLVGGRGVSAAEKLMGKYLTRPCKEVLNSIADVEAIQLSEIMSIGEKMS